MPPANLLRRDCRTNKLVPSHANGLSTYAAAFWLYDTIVHVTEPELETGEVLLHAKVAEVFGDLPVSSSSLP